MNWKNSVYIGVKNLLICNFLNFKAVFTKKINLPNLE